MSEWVAAVALLIQAAILGLQWLILRRHAVTFEQHKDIAATQAETAKLIGTILQQQGKVAEEQTKIMADQLRFHKAVESQAERTKLFELLLEMQSTFRHVSAMITNPQIPPGSTFSPSTKASINQAWLAVEKTILPCQKALMTAVYIPASDREYFMKYSQALDALARTQPTSPAQLLTFENQYSYSGFAEKFKQLGGRPV